MKTDKNKQYLTWGLIILAIILLFMWIGRGEKAEAPAPAPAPQEETQTISDDRDVSEESVHSRPVSPAVASARVHLATRLDMKVLDVVVLSETAKDWPDACLGITAPDILCAQVITPGYEVKMLAQGKEYTYRTNLRGSLVKAEN